DKRFAGHGLAGLPSQDFSIWRFFQLNLWVVRISIHLSRRTQYLISGPIFGASQAIQRMLGVLRFQSRTRSNQREKNGRAQECGSGVVNPSISSIRHAMKTSFEQTRGPKGGTHDA